MARIVRHDATSPIKIEPPSDPATAKPIFVCACGISKTFPFCDGSHKRCRDEEAGAVYEYDPVTGEARSKRPE